VASEIKAGRAFVGLAAAVGTFFFIQRLIGDDSLWDAFIKGAGAAFAVMILSGVARRFWKGERVESAQGPGGWGMTFARATLRPFRVLEERLDAQMRAVNDRIRLVEEDVRELKGPAAGSDRQE
jgi:hypothetical protein